MNKPHPLTKLIVPTLFLLFLIPAARAQEFQTAEQLELAFSASSEITPVQESSPYNLESVTAYLNLYPRTDWRQTVNSFTTDPEATTENSSLLFHWSEPELTCPFSLSSRITTKNSIRKIKETPAFPPDVPGLVNYTRPTQAIDSDDPSITNLANSLAEGETDLYVVAHKFSTWVNNNLEYDLSCEKDVFPASWALENRRGVCAEFSSLFIALCRSVGIPSRYVAGMAYSNIPETHGMGPHAWAEVYFPGTGWVPFDPTFGQNGWIDATHIKLAEQQDSNQSSIRYEWLGSGVSLETETLKMSAEVTDTTGTIQNPLSVTVSPFYSESGPGSYNIIQAVLENTAEYYFATDVIFGKTENLEMSGPPREQILLKPGETKTIYRMVQVNPDLESGYIYTLPTGLNTVRNLSAYSEIESKDTDRVYTRQEIEDYLILLEEEETKAYSRELDLSCSPETREVYTEEETRVVCTLHNQGNTVLNDLEACLDSDCMTLDLQIGQYKNITFDLVPESEGTLDLLASIRNQDVSRTEKIRISISEKPAPGILEQITGIINVILSAIAGMFS